MRLVRYLQYWLRGTGAPLPVADFVPETQPLRQWAHTLPWAARGSAIEQSCDTRFPKQSPRGRRPVPIRVLFALEFLKHALGASDEDICHRLRTDLAVLEAWASARLRAIPPKPTVGCLRRAASFVAAWTKPSWMPSSPCHLLPLWTRGWSGQRLSSSIPFRVHTAANASRKRPPCIRRNKNARAPRPPRPAAPPPDPATPPPSRRPAARPHQGDAWLWPPLSRPRSALGDAGASHRTTAPSARGTHRNLWPEGPQRPAHSPIRCLRPSVYVSPWRSRQHWTTRPASGHNRPSCPMASSAATVHGATPRSAPWPRWSKARAMARRSLGDSLASPQNPRLGLALPTSYRKGIRVSQGRGCPCWTRSNRP
jgi:hypothetical protein